MRASCGRAEGEAHQPAASRLPFDLRRGEDAPAELHCLAALSLLQYPDDAPEVAAAAPLALVRRLGPCSVRQEAELPEHPCRMSVACLLAGSYGTVRRGATFLIQFGG